MSCDRAHEWAAQRLMQPVSKYYSCTFVLKKFRLSYQPQIRNK